MFAPRLRVGDWWTGLGSELPDTALKVNWSLSYLRRCVQALRKLPVPDFEMICAFSRVEFLLTPGRKIELSGYSCRQLPETVADGSRQ